MHLNVQFFSDKSEGEEGERASAHYKLWLSEQWGLPIGEKNSGGFARGQAFDGRETTPPRSQKEASIVVKRGVLSANLSSKLIGVVLCCWSVVTPLGGDDLRGD